MQLPQRPRPQPHKGRRNRLANGKPSRVDLEHHPAPACHRLGWLLQRPIHPARGRAISQRRAPRDRRLDRRRVQNERVGCRRRVKCRRVDAKIFREDGFGRMCDPVVYIEGRACAVKVWVVEAVVRPCVSARHWRVPHLGGLELTQGEIHSLPPCLARHEPRPLGNTRYPQR